MFVKQDRAFDGVLFIRTLGGGGMKFSITVAFPPTS